MGRIQLDEQAIFDVARQIPTPEGRESYLAHVCGDRTALKARVEALLRVHDDTEDFLQTPPTELKAAVQISAVSEQPGQQIGNYKLLQQIGEGGFGVVYMAEQQKPVRRKVALKIIKPGMDTKEVIARFEAERQALALMDHPNIARVLDAGSTDSGRPYFVMELVNGIPITEYCDQNNLSPERRLELFATVCQAIHHAHQRGVIHRDIKPGNILTTVKDGRAVVKVIDFGVAKAINQRLTEKTLFTKFSQFVGTPAYMSPDQAAMGGLDVDTRTDIYSLGVVLYELLTGGPPFDGERLREAGYDEIRRIICEEDPPKPSTKIGSLQDDRLIAVCAHRGIDPKRLAALLRGDLDWIVLKAMEKDRDRRYETAKDLATDVARYLDDQPVEASPPSTWYLVRKFVRRNKVALGITAAMVLLLVSLTASVGIAAFARLDRRVKDAELEVARRQQEEAEEGRRIAEEKRKELNRKAADLQWLQKTIPRLRKMTDSEDWSEAFALAEKAKATFPEDPNVENLWRALSSTCTIVSDPRGAEVYVRPYGDKDAQFTHVGTTPLNRIALGRGVHHWRIEADGYQPAEGCAGGDAWSVKATLIRPSGKTSNMVAVEGTVHDGRIFDQARVSFLVDRCEISNRQFKRFVDAGGYQNKKYWRSSFLDGKKELPFEKAVARFVDSTGKPGPAFWKNGTYPPGEGDYPVCGVSWCEAAAYARSVGKSLPPVKYWRLASGTRRPATRCAILDASNMRGHGPLPVGQGRGIGPFGTQDMFGNVSEWAWNKGASGQRYVMSSAWDDPEYEYGEAAVHDAFERDRRIGFRCAIYDSPPPGIKDPIVPPRQRKRTYSISEQEIDRILKLYAYTPRRLRPKREQVAVTDTYRHERITIDAPSSSSRVILHLFLPRQRKPPYQTVVYFPGSAALYRPKFPGRLGSVLGKVVRNGRAVCWPIYKGHFERRGEKGRTPKLQMMIETSQELRAAVDYLQTRDDIDMNRLAYVGLSLGAAYGPMFLALEDRFKAGVLLGAGVLRGAKAGNPYSFASRVTTPLIMVNGDNDDEFPLETSQIPLFRALATPQRDKKHLLKKGGHGRAFDPDATIAWLDRCFGNPDEEQTREKATLIEVNEP